MLSATTALLASAPLQLLAFSPPQSSSSVRHRCQLEEEGSSVDRSLVGRPCRRHVRLSYGASSVTDPDGTTGPEASDPFPPVDFDALPEAQYDPAAHPVPHQPWRRGDTDGCHDPLTAPWRLEAEDLIEDAVRLVGGRVADVTWYLGKCVISLDEESLTSYGRVVAYEDGPPVRVEYPDLEVDYTPPLEEFWDEKGRPYSAGDTRRYDDPLAGTEDEIFTEEDELLDYEQYDEETELELLRANAPRETDPDTGEELPPREPRCRVQRAMEAEEERESRAEELPTKLKPDWMVDQEAFEDHRRRTRAVGPSRKWTPGPPAHWSADGADLLDEKALSTISKAIQDALNDEDVEERLRIISRHDLVLTSPLHEPCVLDGQREFDGARGLDVYVDTRDPWGSNRVLFGKLVERNAMDVVINQDNSGRMVTVPNSMVHEVLLPSGLAEKRATAAQELRAELFGDALHRELGARVRIREKKRWSTALEAGFEGHLRRTLPLEEWKVELLGAKLRANIGAEEYAKWAQQTRVAAEIAAGIEDTVALDDPFAYPAAFASFLRLVDDDDDADYRTTLRAFLEFPGRELRHFVKAECLEKWKEDAERELGGEAGRRAERTFEQGEDDEDRTDEPPVREVENVSEAFLEFLLRTASVDLDDEANFDHTTALEAFLESVSGGFANGDEFEQWQEAAESELREDRFKTWMENKVRQQGTEGAGERGEADEL